MNKIEIDHNPIVEYPQLPRPSKKKKQKKSSVTQLSLSAHETAATTNNTCGKKKQDPN